MQIGLLHGCENYKTQSSEASLRNEPVRKQADQMSFSLQIYVILEVFSLIQTQRIQSKELFLTECFLQTYCRATAD